MSDISKLETSIGEIKQSLQEELDFVLAAKEKVEQYHKDTVAHVTELATGIMTEMDNVAAKLRELISGNAEPVP